MKKLCYLIYHVHLSFFSLQSWVSTSSFFITRVSSYYSERGNNVGINHAIDTFSSPELDNGFFEGDFFGYFDIWQDQGHLANNISITVFVPPKKMIPKRILSLSFIIDFVRCHVVPGFLEPRKYTGYRFT